MLSATIKVKVKQTLTEIYGGPELSLRRFNRVTLHESRFLIRRELCEL